MTFLNVLGVGCVMFAAAMNYQGNADYVWFLIAAAALANGPRR